MAYKLDLYYPLIPNEPIHSIEKFKTESGFTENYLGFRYDVQIKKLEEVLHETLDPHLIVADLKSQIEICFGYNTDIQPSSQTQKQELLRYEKLLIYQIRSKNETSFFAQKASGLTIDLNSLNSNALLWYYHEMEIFNFYKYLRGWKPSLNKTEYAPQLEDSPTFKNNFDNVNEMDVYNHFKKFLVDKKHLTETQLTEYLQLAFEEKKLPKTRFKFSNITTKQSFVKIFYAYYKNVASKPHYKQTQYAALLGNYFEGFKTENVITNFNK